jgi:hypothetical protein
MFNTGQLTGWGSELASAATAASSGSWHNETAGSAGEGEDCAVRPGLGVTLPEVLTVGAQVELELSEFVLLAAAVSLLVAEAVSEPDGERDAVADWRGVLEAVSLDVLLPMAALVSVADQPGEPDTLPDADSDGEMEAVGVYEVLSEAVGDGLAVVDGD